jgi:hypothetical protein
MHATSVGEREMQLVKTTQCDATCSLTVTHYEQHRVLVITHQTLAFNLRNTLIKCRHV